MEMASINPSYSRVRLGFGLRPVYWVCLGLTWRATPAPNKNPRRGNLPSPWSSALLAAWRGWRVGHPSPGIRKNSELCDIDWWFWTITLIIPFNTNMMELPWFLDFQRFWMSAKKGTRFDANGKKVLRVDANQHPFRCPWRSSGSAEGSQISCSRVRTRPCIDGSTSSTACWAKRSRCLAECWWWRMVKHIPPQKTHILKTTMWGPPVIRWFINPMNTIVIGTINHSYWSYKPT